MQCCYPTMTLPGRHNPEYLDWKRCRIESLKTRMRIIYVFVGH